MFLSIVLTCIKFFLEENSIDFRDTWEAISTHAVLCRSSCCLGPSYRTSVTSCCQIFCFTLLIIITVLSTQRSLKHVKNVTFPLPPHSHPQITGRARAERAWDNSISPSEESESSPLCENRQELKPCILSWWYLSFQYQRCWLHCHWTQGLRLSNWRVCHCPVARALIWKMRAVVKSLDKRREGSKLKTMYIMSPIPSHHTGVFLWNSCFSNNAAYFLL